MVNEAVYKLIADTYPDYKWYKSDLSDDSIFIFTDRDNPHLTFISIKLKSDGYYDVHGPWHVYIPSISGYLHEPNSVEHMLNHIKTLLAAVPGSQLLMHERY